jgi:hypothetical protein
MKTKLLLTIGLVVLLVTAAGSAQAGQGVRVHIPFSFAVNGAVLPAGEYEFLPGNGQEFIQILSLTNGPSAGTIVVTRLNASSYAAAHSCEVIFDKVGDAYTLSELWLPQTSGFQLYVTKEPHEKKVVVNGRP